MSKTLASCVATLAALLAAAPAGPAQTYLKASNTDATDQFGHAVSVSGDTLAVSAYVENSAATGVDGNQGDDSAENAGAVYVFVRDGDTWVQQAYLKASNTQAHDQFGYDLGLDGDTLVVGARFEDSSATGIDGDQGDNGVPNAGAVYVFTRSGSSWSQQAYLKASHVETGAFGDRFGSAVAVSGDTLVVGAPFEDSRATGVDGDQADDTVPEAGAAYVFVRNGTTWSQQAYLKASNPDEDDQFGDTVAVDGDTVVVGAHWEDSRATGIDGDQTDNDAGEAGAAYVFTRTGNTWSQQAYVKASNAGDGDVFGGALALRGDTLVVGAFGEDSSATGVGGNQADDAAPGAGAAYVFTRSGDVWSQEVYLKASNTDAGDGFGTAVDLDGALLAVSAPGEDSRATGVGGDQADDGSSGSGAAYAFARPASGWSQVAYLKASNTQPNDSLGFDLSVAGGTVVAGAPIEDSDATGVDGDQGDNSAPSAGASYVHGLGGWSDEGCALAGGPGEPLLQGTGSLHAGTPGTLDLTGAAPNAFCILFVSVSSTPTPFFGGTLKTVPVTSEIPLNTGPAGAIPVGFTFPSGVPSGFEFWVQYGIEDAGAVFGVALSNAVKGTAP